MWPQCLQTVGSRQGLCKFGSGFYVAVLGWGFLRLGGVGGRIWGLKLWGSLGCKFLGCSTFGGVERRMWVLCFNFRRVDSS